jgi:hypothetical protein
VICGLITSVCVQATALGAFSAGFRVAVAHDACGDRSRARHEAALLLYGDYMYEKITSLDIVERTVTPSQVTEVTNEQTWGVPIAKGKLPPKPGVSLSQISLVDYSIKHVPSPNSHFDAPHSLPSL